MDSIVKDWLSGNPEPWQLLIGAIVLVTLVAQRLASLRDTWFDFRAGRSKLLLEKQQLEILKLRYEIEAIRKANQLPEITSVPLAPQVTKETRVVQPRRSPTWEWLTRHPVFAELLLRVAQVIVGLYLFASIAGLIAVPFAAFQETEHDESKWLLVGVTIMYGVFAYVCYMAYRRLGRWVVDLRATDTIMFKKVEE